MLIEPGVAFLGVDKEDDRQHDEAPCPIEDEHEVQIGVDIHGIKN
jgi:hypothetical protein